MCVGGWIAGGASVVDYLRILIVGCYVVRCWQVEQPLIRKHKALHTSTVVTFSSVNLHDALSSNPGRPRTQFLTSCSYTYLTRTGSDR